MIKAWMRLLTVTFTSTTLCKEVTIGRNENDNLDISVVGYKYLSALKDNFTVEIKNLTYSEVVRLIRGKFDRIEIKCGYKSMSTPHSIFKGYVMYISNKLDDASTNTVYVICTSRLMGVYNKKMNLTLNSSLNMYNVLNFLCKRAGITDANISEEFKTKILHTTTTTSSTIGNVLEQLLSNSDTYEVQSDASGCNTVTIFDSYRTDRRLIPINSNNVLLTNGYPTISSDGVSMSMLPTFNFMPGDTIQIDNSIIDVSLTSLSEVKSSPLPTIFMDEQGLYTIYQIEYRLENRGRNFYCGLLAKSRSLTKGLRGEK